MTTYVALLRGINVGRAKRVAMSDLRRLLEGLGYTDVRTVLQSGNAVFTAAGRRTPDRMAADIRAAIAGELGLDVAVVFRSSAEVRAVVDGCRLATPGRDPSRLLVSFMSAQPSTAARATLEAAVAEGIGEEELQLGDRVAYLWCPGGLMASRLHLLVTDATLGVSVTARNWRTVTRLADLTASGRPGS